MREGRMDKIHRLRGYHATTPECAAEILSRGFKLSDHSYEWLGKGIYFFQDTKDYARYWARNERKEGLLAEPAIIGAEINYERFLDLVEHQHLLKLKKFYERLEKSARTDYGSAKAAQRAHDGVWKPRAHPLDCFVINEAALAAEEGGEPFYALRAVFFEGDPIYPKSHLFDRQHIQVAVREPKLIHKIWREE
jgi:hypothetical protein